MPDADRRPRSTAARCRRAPRTGVADEVQPDRPGHDREREDRVGEVVQRPRGRDDRPAGSVSARRGRAARGDRVAGPPGAAALVTRAMIVGPRRVGCADGTGHRRGRTHADPRDIGPRPASRPAGSSARVADQGRRPDHRAAVGRRPRPRRASTPDGAAIVDEDGVIVEGFDDIIAVAGRGRSGRRGLVLDGFLTKQATRPAGLRRRLVGRDAVDGLVSSASAAIARSTRVKLTEDALAARTFEPRRRRSATSRPTCCGSTTRRSSTSRCSSGGASSRASSANRTSSGSGRSSGRRSCRGSARGRRRASTA